MKSSSKEVQTRLDLMQSVHRQQRNIFRQKRRRIDSREEVPENRLQGMQSKSEEVVSRAGSRGSCFGRDKEKAKFTKHGLTLDKWGHKSSQQSLFSSLGGINGFSSSSVAINQHSPYNSNPVNTIFGGTGASMLNFQQGSQTPSSTQVSKYISMLTREFKSMFGEFLPGDKTHSPSKPSQVQPTSNIKQQCRQLLHLFTNLYVQLVNKEYHSKCKSIIKAEIPHSQKVTTVSDFDKVEKSAEKATVKRKLKFDREIKKEKRALEDQISNKENIPSRKSPFEEKYQDVVVDRIELPESGKETPSKKHKIPLIPLETLKVNSERPQSSLKPKPPSPEKPVSKPLQPELPKKPSSLHCKKPPSYPVSASYQPTTLQLEASPRRSSHQRASSSIKASLERPLLGSLEKPLSKLGSHSPISPIGMVQNQSDTNSKEIFGDVCGEVLITFKGGGLQDRNTDTWNPLEQSQWSEGKVPAAFRVSTENV